MNGQTKAKIERLAELLADDLLQTAQRSERELVYLEVQVKYPNLLKRKGEAEKLFTRSGAKELALRYLQSADLTEEELAELP